MVNDTQLMVYTHSALIMGGTKRNINLFSTWK